jgi:hypothetical protein
MGVKSYDQQVVTGITNSGTTDGSGSWATIDTGAQLTALPDDASGLLIKVVNLSSSNRWAGIRTTGKTNNEFQIDFSPSNLGFYFVPFPSASKQISFYRESADIEFRVVCALDSTWVFFDIDGTRPTIASTSGILTTRTVSSCPESSTIISTGVRWCPQAQSTTFANNPTGQQLMQLDASKNVKINTNGTPTVIGYTTGDAAWGSWLSSTAYTADSTWRSGATDFTGKRLAFFGVDKSTATTRYDFRARGSSYNPAVTASAFDESFFTDLNSSGQWDYGFETGAAVTLYAMASFSDYETGVASIASIDQLIESEESTYAIDGSLTVTGVTVSDGTYSADATDVTAVDDENGTFIAPTLTHGEVGARLGAVTVTATDGVDTTDPFADTYSKAGYTTVILTSVSEFNYLAGFSPALKVDSQVAFDPTKGAIAVDGAYSGTYEGSQIIWDHDPDDGIWRSVNIVTSGGSVVPQGGLTVRGLTVSGLSVSGLSVRGL